MLVFLDESGDPGFKLNAGSSPVFVVAMVIFETSRDAERTEQKVRDLQAELRVKPEFKFSKLRDEFRDRFFDGICGCPFTVRAIVVQKAIIRSDNLKDHKDRFYNYFVKQLMKHDNGTLLNARLRIDGSGDRAFKKELLAQLRKSLQGRISEIRFSDSESDSLIQLADMCAGAIARSAHTERKDPRRWLDKLRPRVTDIWSFR
jgi:hypothetical protein